AAPLYQLTRLDIFLDHGSKHHRLAIYRSLQHVVYPIIPEAAADIRDRRIPVQPRQHTDIVDDQHIGLRPAAETLRAARPLTGRPRATTFFQQRIPNGVPEQPLDLPHPVFPDLMRRYDEAHLGMRIGIMIQLLLVLLPGTARDDHRRIPTECRDQWQGLDSLRNSDHPVEPRIPTHRDPVR